MAYTNKELQRRFKEKMYKAGFKQISLWVEKKEAKKVVNMSQEDFIEHFEKLTARWDDGNLSRLYILLLKIIKGKKEAAGLKKRP
ncbi:MAG: hypothetical protein LBB89_02935 [Treponema sp.]|jgi:hypothetical protein|nr:hypothetical protein [Treponema sp.]